MSGGEIVNVQGVDDGTCYSSSEMLQSYRYVGAGTLPGASASVNQWHNSLDEPTQQLGGGAGGKQAGRRDGRNRSRQASPRASGFGCNEKFG